MFVCDNNLALLIYNYILLVDGSWSAWFISGTCTVSCGIGARPRGRLCNNPTPANCGLYCNGNDNGYIVCSTSACPGNLIIFYLFHIMIYTEKVLFFLSE